MHLIYLINGIRSIENEPYFHRQHFGKLFMKIGAATADDAFMKSRIVSLEGLFQFRFRHTNGNEIEKVQHLWTDFLFTAENNVKMIYQK